MNKIYIFSGLGVDERAFRYVDFGDFQVQFVDWIEPDSNEEISTYARRISEPFQDENPILIGLSFGGILAIEISKIIPVQKIILISSAKTKFELSKGFRLSIKLNFHKFMPKFFLQKSNRITDWFFGAKTQKEKDLLKEIVKDTEPGFFFWAVNEIGNWENTELPKNTVHIHGAKDKMIPIKNVKADFTIKKGEHFMVLNKSKEISEILQSELAKCRKD
ncbi:MAG: alpha/beta hydrolase [Brumimicrobium sp.]